MKKVFVVSIVLNLCLLAGYFVRDSRALGTGGGGATPSQNGDVNCDGTLDLSDAVYTLSFLFLGGSPPCNFDCPPPVAVCGNGIRELGEECDDGNTVNGDGCDSICHMEHVAACGDAIVEGGEQCDDGNTVNGDGCSATCQLESRCGDGVIEGGEVCDGNDLRGMTCQSLGFLGGSLACSSRCEFDVSGCIVSICGDGIVSGIEECDDGNLVNGDGCNAECRLE